MKVGVIGTGVMGKNHVRIYSELKNVEEIYVYDSNKDKAKGTKIYGTLVCDSVEELLSKVDAVSICVPTIYHFSIAKKVLERDVHCLIEKPITSTVKEGEELLNLLKNKEDLIVGVGHIERFNPVIDEVKRIAGDPIYVEIKRHNPSSKRVTDVSIVEDLMIHDIDIVFNVLFNNEEKYVVYGAGNLDVCQAIITVENTLVSLSASKIASKKFRTIYIESEEFSIEGDLMTQEVYVYRKPEWYGMENEKYTQENIIEKILVNKVEPLKVELKMFVDCVRRSKVFPVTPEQALRNLKVCEEIKRYLR